MTSQEKKETFFGHKKNRIFRSLNNCTFPKGITHAFGQKMPLFVVI